MSYRLKDKQKDPEESLDSYMVTLRGNAWNTIWPSLEKMYEKLDELGIDDECILKGDNHGKI